MLTRALLLLFVFCLSWTPGRAQKTKHATAIRVTLRGIPLVDGSDIAVICRRRGKKTTFQVMKIRKNTLTVKVPPKDGTGDSVSFFFIPRMSSLDQFEGFLAHPENWTWAQIQTGSGPGQLRRVTRNFIPKGEKVQFRGRVLDPEGRPLDCLSIRFSKRAKARSTWDLDAWMHQGYDPCTGRFWTMRKLVDSTRLSDWRLDLLPYARPGFGSNPRIAPLLRVAWPEDKELLARMQRAGSIQVRFEALTEESLIRYAVSLLFEAGVQFQESVPVPQGFAFHGLPAGSYRLQVKLSTTADVLFEKKAMLLEEGQKLDLGMVNLSDKLTRIQISVQDDEGKPIQARVGYVTQQTVGTQFFADMMHSTTDASCKRSLLIPKAGVALMIAKDGWGPQVLAKVDKDLVVTLRKPHRLALKLVGIDGHPELLKDLYIRAQPKAGYPKWAWQILSQFGALRSRDSGPDIKAGVLPCVAKLESGAPMLMHIPNPGLWKFELVYFKNYKVLRIPLPALDSVDIQSPKQDLRIEVPRPILRRARTHFEVLLRRR